MFIQYHLLSKTDRSFERSVFYFGKTTTYTYDDNNNLITTRDALGNTTTYEYDALNQLVKVTDAKNHSVEYGYDALGRRTTIKDAKGNTFTTEYDDNGNITKVIDAKGKTVSETVYNCLNLPDTVVDNSGKTITYTYTALGKIDTIKFNEMEAVQQYSYDSLGRNTAVRDLMSGNSSAVYDVLGNITSLKGPTNVSTSYTYDNLGRLTAETTPFGSNVEYTYNALSLKATHKNARGDMRTYSYDSMGRMMGYTDTDDSVSYTYDDNGNVLTVTDDNGTVTRQYDDLNRVISYTDTYGKTIGYEYDAVGNITKITYPDNTAVNYAYDENNCLVCVTDWANRTTLYTYDENKNVTGVVKPDGSVTTTVYDDKQRITSTEERTAGGALIVGFSYVYDELGRIYSETHLAENKKMCYTYDDLSRVTVKTTVDLSDNTQTEETYSYDAAGNITAAPESSFNYLNNRLITYNGQGVSFDADGNMTSVLMGEERAEFEYDFSNRLISAGDVDYTYNAENTRIRTQSAAYDTTYTYNTNCALSQLLTKTTNGFETKYVYGLGLIGEEKGDNFKTYHFDYRGSTVAITDMSGSITDTFKYDTYGRLVDRTGTSYVILRYNGRDGAVSDRNGLVYMRARYYSPEHKRFVNADILHGGITDSTSLNRYAYVNGNPVSFVDPLGLIAQRGGPTDLEAAYMADLIYKKDFSNTVGLEGGWEYYETIEDDENGGFRMVAYKKVLDNGEVAYTVVNKGSSTFDDWVENVLQPFGKSNDMERSIEFARKFVSEHPDAQITFVGHSKGGAEAAANAVATNKDAILFNPATACYNLYDLNTSEYNASMKTYKVQGEMLGLAYGLIGAMSVFPRSLDVNLCLEDELIDVLIDVAAWNIFTSRKLGSTITLKSQGDPLYNHGRDAIISALGGE